MYSLLLMADPNLAAIKQYIPDAQVLLAYIVQSGQSDQSGQNDNKKLVGIAVLTTVNSTTQELKNIAIAEQYQGKGYAKVLIKAAKQQAQTLGAKELTVGTGNSRLSQLALYHKCGFRLSHIIKDFFKSYPQPIIENGIECIDMVMLSCKIDDKGSNQ